MPRPNRREHYTQKLNIGGKDGRTIYLSVDHEVTPTEIFIRVKEPGIDEENVALYDALARSLSLAMEYGAPIEEVGNALLGMRCPPAGPVQGHERIKNCQGPIDLIGRHLLVTFAGRDDLAHVPRGEE